MASKKFKVGDVVYLASDLHHPMTVTKTDNINSTSGEYEPDGIIQCQWFVSGEVKTAKFHEDALLKEEQ